MTQGETACVMGKQVAPQPLLALPFRHGACNEGCWPSRPPGGRPGARGRQRAPPPPATGIPPGPPVRPPPSCPDPNSTTSSPPPAPPAGGSFFAPADVALQMGTISS